MRRYRGCWGGHGDVSLDWKDGRWEVLELCADAGFTRRHRFWLTAFMDYITA